MRFRHCEFGVIDIDGVTYEHDLVVDRGEIHERKKMASTKFRETYAPATTDDVWVTAGARCARCRGD
jgi:hypothetical protein